MDILSIEKAKTELSNFLEYSSSSRLKLKKISDFFALLLEQESANLIGSYLIEFIPKYLDHLTTYSPFGVKPEFTQSIIDVNEKLLSLNGMNACPPLAEINEFKEQLNRLNEGIKNKLRILLEILNGKEIPFAEPKVLFPVIEETEGSDTDSILGAIDSLTIKISKTKEKDKFIVVPSESEKDKKLEGQINISWLKAKEFCKRYSKKIADYHEVIISFDENLGIYKGDSVGTALTIGFIEELLRFYNSQTILQPIVGTAFTGGVDESGKVNKVSKAIVEKKVEITFFSNCGTLAVSKEDETFALYKLYELKKAFPARDLSIVGVKDVTEILLRRDLVEIKKQKIIIRTSKFVKKNWVSALFVVILSTAISYYLTLDLDDNPTILENNGTTLFVKNKNGRILWTRQRGDPINISSDPEYAKMFYYRIDIDNNGINEIILTNETNINELENGRVACFDKKGNLLWKYTFTDSTKTKTKYFPLHYSISLVDTTTFQNEKVLVLRANNREGFFSAIFILNLKTGKRLPEAFWCSGHLTGAIIKDANGDGALDLLGIGCDNGFNDAVFFVIDSLKLRGCRASIENYQIETYISQNIKSYIRIPKIDYDTLTQQSRPNIGGPLRDVVQTHKYELTFYRRDTTNTLKAILTYKLDYNLKDVVIDVVDEFTVLRNNLVKNGILKPPLTNTKEFADLLKSRILYWKNGKWLKRHALD